MNTKQSNRGRGKRITAGGTKCTVRLDRSTLNALHYLVQVADRYLKVETDHSSILRTAAQLLAEDVAERVRKMEKFPGKDEPRGGAIRFELRSWFLSGTRENEPSYPGEYPSWIVDGAFERAEPLPTLPEIERSWQADRWRRYRTDDTAVTQELRELFHPTTSSDATED